MLILLTARTKKGKLRLIYEASPMAFIIEQAGRRATTGEEDILLRFKPSQIHERTEYGIIFFSPLSSVG